jgi:predicted transcriptional regulator
MDLELLTDIGLTAVQAKVYILLTKKGPHSPPAIATELSESRTNTYNVLEKLTDVGLVRRFEQNKKYMYQAEPPIALEKLIQQKRDAILGQERNLHAKMPDMLSAYFNGNEKPGVKFFQGKTELKEIYLDEVHSGEPIYIIRPERNMDVYDFKFMTEIRHTARKNKLKRYAITPDSKERPKNYRESDPHMLLNRTWINPEDYTVPVEWNAYGDKVAIMSFGSEAIGMIIESPQIAEAFRQLYRLLEEGIQRRPNYDSLPRNARAVGYMGKDD